jgi:hypothetical protein
MRRKLVLITFTIWTVAGVGLGQGTITTSAGNGTFGSSGDGGQAGNAAIGFPKGVAVDGAGNLYIMDALNNRIRRVNTAGVISTFAGTGFPFFSGDGGPATSASISLCGTAVHQGIAVDSTGNVYFSDCANNRIRKIDTAGIITTVAGSGGFTNFSGDGGPATSATLGTPWGLTVAVRR